MNQHAIIETQVAQHYARSDLEQTILKALAAAGKDLDHLTTSDLAAIDEFHTGGRQATIELAALAGFAPGMHILDIGCGIGGPSRFFAQECGCRVTGIDITADFIRAAEALAKRVGLDRSVAYKQASALSLPFEKEAFDGAYMMHVGMNIKDKANLFREARRVLKKGSVFAIYDVMFTGRGQVSFPLPCALTPETCFIAATADYRRELEAAGFEVMKERDRLEAARAFFRQEMARAASAGPSPLGVHLLLKGDASQILANVVDQFEKGVLSPTELVSRAR